MAYIRWLKIVAGPAVGLLIYGFFDLDPGNDKVTIIAAIAGWMACWWMLETVHLAITALLPLFLFPFLGIMTTKEVAPLYMDQVIFLFIGGFIIAFAMERWNLHQRIALKIMLTVGVTPSRVLMGFMLSSYLLSMWISNTATTMMMLPAVLAIIAQIDQYVQEKNNQVATGLLLGLAYAASIGGTATLVGTAPNLIFLSMYGNAFPDGNAITFSNWFLFAMPLSFILLIAIYLVLKKMYFSKISFQALSLDVFRVEYKKLGKVSYEEKAVGLVFVLTALLWFSRADIDFGLFKIKGWSNLFAHPEYILDSTVAILMATTLFFIPSIAERGSMLMSWQQVKKLPFEIILLFGGGFALAKGFEVVGLTDWLAVQLKGLQFLPAIAIVIGLCTFMTFLSELTSNTASTLLVLPIIVVLSMSIDIHPLLIMVPVTISASLAFMLPVATPPNTIIFGSNRINIPDMVRTGFILNLIGIAVVTLMTMTLGKWVFGIE